MFWIIILEQTEQILGSAGLNWAEQRDREDLVPG